MIRTIFACCLALSFGARPTTAQQMSTFNWGYLYAAQTTRAFVDVGPSLNFQIYKVSFSLPGFDEEVDKKKRGALVGLGIVFGKKPWRFVVRTRYHWIDKHGEFDASNFQFTIGSVWGRSKK